MCEHSHAYELDEVREIEKDLWSDERSREPVAGDTSPSQSMSMRQFEDKLGEAEMTFVAFLVNWCHFCQQFKPTWQQLVTAVADKKDPTNNATINFANKKGEKLNVATLTVDCQKEGKLCKEVGIGGFPSMMLFFESREHFAEYSGRRDVKSLISYLEDFASRTKPKRQVQVSKHAIFEEGCRVHGSLEVPRVPGAIRFEARPYSSVDSLNLDTLNVSHRVHHFTFGAVNSRTTDVIARDGRPRVALYEKFVDRATPDTLTNTVFSMPDFGMTSHHFLQIIPTRTPEGYLYQSTHRHRPMRRNVKNTKTHLDRGIGRQFPSASFTYELSPIEVHIQRPKRRWYDLITGLLGNVGGTVSMISVFNSVASSFT